MIFLDHITHAISFKNEKTEIAKWNLLGFEEYVRVNTLSYPATHIALKTTNKWHGGEFIITGLSISEDPDSPINKFIKYYGEGIQHIAYSFDESVAMEEFYEKIKKSHDLLTSILTYTDANGAKLQQIFTRPSQPYGQFMEFIKRTPGPKGQNFNGFDVRNIDDFYLEYDKHSKWLENKIR